MTYSNGIIPNNTPLSNDSSVSGPSTAAVPATSRTQSATATQSPALDSITSDSASLSLAGAMLSQATQGSDVRFDKVAALQQSIAAGTYNTPASDVASKLVETLQQR